MSTKTFPVLQPYLFFEGRCEEALEFYKHAIGAHVLMVFRWKDSPEPPAPGCAPPDPNKIMHARFKVGDNVVFISDGRCTGKTNFQGFGISLTVATEAEADRLFNGLGDGGQVVMPLGKTFFAARFGMVTDRFGVMWMVLTQPNP